MSVNRTVPKSRRRLPGEPPHGAPPESSTSMRVASSLAVTARKTRVAQLKREAQALRAPFRSRPTPTTPNSASGLPRMAGRIRVLSDNRVRLVDPISLRTTAFDANLERLEWAVQHTEELFPDPARPITVESTSECKPARVTAEPSAEPTPVDWAAVADSIITTPDPKRWSPALVSQLRTLRPPDYPQHRRLRRHLRTSDGRRVHVNVP